MELLIVEFHIQGFRETLSFVVGCNETKLINSQFDEQDNIFMGFKPIKMNRGRFIMQPFLIISLPVQKKHLIFTSRQVNNSTE